MDNVRALSLYFHYYNIINMREPIALLINDIHVSKDNIAEFESNWSETLSVCEKYGITELIVGGDMFTSRASQTLSTLLSVKHALTKAVCQGIYVTIAEGNHDKVNQEEFEGYNHLWSGLKDIEVVDTYKYLSWEGCDFVFLVISYFPENGTFMDKLREAVELTLNENPQFHKSDIILYIHEGVHGALGDFEIEGELKQEPLLEFKSVLCGHYHNRVKIKNTPIEYIGSSRQANFGEDEEKGYTILYSDGTTGFVKNEVNIRYKTVEVSLDKAEKLEFNRDERYRVRLKVRGEEHKAKLFDKQKFLDMGFNKVELSIENPKDVVVGEADIQQKYDKQGIRNEYKNYCNEKSIDSTLGLKYLEN